MDPQLSLLMANLTQVQNYHIVLDPFVGTGSILLACAQFGAHVMGSDIDYLMIHARTKPSRVGEKKRKKGESFRANFDQVNLGSKLIDVMVADASANPWRPENQQIFDAIVTDPPYGIREPAFKVGAKRAETVIPEEHVGKHFPQKVDYGLGDIFADLMAFASRHLRMNGRMAFWIPVNREFYDPEMMPKYPGLELIANCEQVLSSHTSRRCLLYQKVRFFGQL
jgi:tRNA (guanine10-N2)-methyltransferase